MAAQLAAPETYFRTAAFCLAVAVALIVVGGHQRRTGRSVANPDRPVRVGDVLLPEAPPSRGKQLRGRLYLCFGWLLVLGAVVNLINGIRAVRGWRKTEREDPRPVWSGSSRGCAVRGGWWGGWCCRVVGGG